MAVSVVFFMFVPGRFGPAMALVTGSVAPRLRGSFMSFNGAIQQLGAGAASFAAGLLVGRDADGALTGSTGRDGARWRRRWWRSRWRCASGSCLTSSADGSGGKPE